MRTEDKRKGIEAALDWSKHIFEPSRRQVFLGLSAGISAAALSRHAWAQSEKPVRIAAAVRDIPYLWGGPQGGLTNLGYVGYTLYDSLILWDLGHEDRPAVLAPGLAESWQVDPNNSSRWILKLRSGVVFHDGSPFNADAAVWNFDSVFNDKAPQYDPTRVGLIQRRLFGVASAEKIDDQTIAVLSKGPDATLPYQISFLMMVSPAQYAKVGNDWNKFAAQPSGTGPFRFGNLVPRARLELLRNDKYWDAKRIPKAPKVVMLPVSDANARISALRAGQVDLTETIPPDAIPGLEGSGFSVHSNIYPTVAIWSLNMTEDSPFHDIRVRRAISLAVDREGLVQLMNGLAVAAKGFVPPSSPWFGHPDFKLRYDPEEAKKLLAQAGYGPDKRVKTKILMIGGGGGSMDPLKVNQYVQANLADVGVDVEFQVVDYTTLLTIYRHGAKAPQSAGLGGISLPAPTHDPTSTFVRGFRSDLVAPKGYNWGYYNNPKLDEAIKKLSNAFDPKALDEAVAEMNTILVDDAPYLLLFHERNPWAMSKNVKDFVLPQSRFLNLTSVWVE